MAETGIIARMAEILSSKLFKEFLWRQTGPLNINWHCEDIERHQCKTHPSDVVFYYDEPYRESRTYVNCDLKSYAKGSISSPAIKSAIESLARSLVCAEKSKDWRDKYIHNDVDAEICGLLFVYNHDGEYDKDFINILSHVEHVKLEIPKKTKIVVLGPNDIFWLNNVKADMIRMYGDDELPKREHRSFYYPHLVQRKGVQITKGRAATLEMLTAPWIILKYKITEGVGQDGFVIYYRRQGDVVQEFLYLIDHLMHYQMINTTNVITIKMLNHSQNAPALFHKSKDQYIENYDGGEDIKKMFDAIKFEIMSEIQTKFSDIQIGFENV